MSFRRLFLWIFYLSRLSTGWADSEPQHDFVVVWNVPSDSCFKYNITFDLSKFNIIHNENGKFKGEKMTIFYTIGKYPSITHSGEHLNGGIPQLGNLSDHEAQVKEDIAKTIPDLKFEGFGVLDWEDWRPNWRTNWGKMNIYREESRNLVKNTHRDLTKIVKIEAEAEREFELAARSYMESTINISRTLRPHGKWGYYLFPDCYNYELLQKYCSNNTQQYNDKLSWLFNSSSVLYPSIYISEKNVTDNAVRIYGLLNEAKRVGPKMPIFPYSIVHYQERTNFVKAEDLIITIGQVGALRLPGVVLWGASDAFASKWKCEDFSVYFKTTLGPTLNKIRSVLKTSTETLQFPDSLDAKSWAEQINQFYK